jgi:hypothetical protein
LNTVGARGRNAFVGYRVAVVVGAVTIGSAVLIAYAATTKSAATTIDVGLKTILYQIATAWRIAGRGAAVANTAGTIAASGATKSVTTGTTIGTTAVLVTLAIVNESVVATGATALIGLAYPRGAVSVLIDIASIGATLSDTAGVATATTAIDVGLVAVFDTVGIGRRGTDATQTNPRHTVGGNNA